MSDGPLIQTEQFNLTVANDTVHMSTIESGPVVFPSFNHSLFPGMIYVSFFRFNWAVHSLSRDCSLLTSRFLPLELTPFTLTLETTEGVRVIVPSEYPSLSSATCVNDPTPVLVLNHTDPSLSLYFPDPPTIGSVDTLVNSYCYVPRKTFLFKVPVVLPPLNIGNVRSIEENVNGMYGSVVNGTYRVRDDVPSFAEGLTEVLVLSTVVYHLPLLPSIQPVSFTVNVAEETNFTLIGLNYRNDSRVYFRTSLSPFSFIVPGQLIQTSSVGSSFTYKMYSCGYESASAVVSFVDDLVRAVFPLGNIVLDDSEGYTVGAYVKLQGFSDDVTEFSMKTSRGHFENEALCNGGCSHFSLTKTVSEINDILHQTILVLPADTIGQYDGMLISTDGVISYLRYLRPSLPPSKSIIQRQNEIGEWYVYTLLGIFVLFTLALIGYWCYLAMPKRLKKSKTKTSQTNEHKEQ